MIYNRQNVVHINSDWEVLRYTSVTKYTKFKSILKVWFKIKSYKCNQYIYINNAYTITIYILVMVVELISYVFHYLGVYVCLFFKFASFSFLYPVVVSNIHIVRVHRHLTLVNFFLHSLFVLFFLNFIRVLQKFFFSSIYTCVQPNDDDGSQPKLIDCITKCVYCTFVVWYLGEHATLLRIDSADVCLAFLGASPFVLYSKILFEIIIRYIWFAR